MLSPTQSIEVDLMDEIAAVFSSNLLDLVRIRKDLFNELCLCPDFPVCNHPFMLRFPH